MLWFCLAVIFNPMFNPSVHKLCPPSPRGVWWPPGWLCWRCWRCWRCPPSRGCGGGSPAPPRSWCPPRPPPPPAPPPASSCCTQRGDSLAAMLPEALQYLTMTSTTVMMTRTRPRQPSTSSTTVNLCREEPDTSLSSPGTTCTCHVSHWATCDV